MLIEGVDELEALLPRDAEGAIDLHLHLAGARRGRNAGQEAIVIVVALVHLGHAAERLQALGLLLGLDAGARPEDIEVRNEKRHAARNLRPKESKLVLRQVENVVTARHKHRVLESVDGPTESLAVRGVAVVADEADPANRKAHQQPTKPRPGAVVHVQGDAMAVVARKQIPVLDQVLRAGRTTKRSTHVGGRLDDTLGQAQSGAGNFLELAIDLGKV